MDATLPLAGGRSLSSRATHNGRLARGESITARHRAAGALDLVQRAPGVPRFAELDSAAVEADLLGVPVRVCSLAHLRVMKQARGASQDLADLERLPEDTEPQQPSARAITICCTSSVPSPMVSTLASR